MANRRGRQINPAFLAAHKVNNSSAGGSDNLSEKILDQARKSGTLNLSNRGLSSVPDKVWKINIEAPKQGQALSFDESGDNWWEMVDLSKLILSSNTLTSLSSDIKLLNLLTCLDLHDNKLTLLPEELGQLTELKVLNISSNELKELPESLSKLSQLTQLLCQYNHLTCFPNQICHLPLLNTLNISFNELKTLSPGVGNMRTLTKLDVKHNLLNEICEDFNRLTGLVQVDFSENKINYLPVLFDSPKEASLEILLLHQNHLTLFPRFNGCHKLKELSLANNRIEEITGAQLQRVTSLVTLNLASNKLKNLPEEITSLESLMRLDLCGNNLDALPFSLGNMETLTNLSVDRNPLRSIRSDIVAKGTQALKKLLRDRQNTEPSDNGDSGNSMELVKPGQNTGLVGVAKNVVNVQLIRETHTFNFSRQKISEVPNNVWEALAGETIHTVVFSHNLLPQMPSGLFQFANCLNHLDLSCNKIIELPEDICRMQSLRTLTLLNNCIQTLPSSLSQLKNLLCLDVSQNPLKCLPNCVYELTGLESLLAATCKLQTIDALRLQKMESLRTLDLQSNDLASLPSELGLCRQLTSLRLEGNPFRAPRPAILAKGTLAILDYLKNRIAE